MSAYLVIVRSNTKDPAGLLKYAELARHSPHEKMEILAAKTGRFEVLEGGEPAEAVVVMRFPTWDDALAWYRSDAYQKALPHRQAAASYRAYLVEGVS
jgi:uncharacterized protein (DUF1330 family)